MFDLASHAIPHGWPIPVTPKLLTVPVESTILFIALLPESATYSVVPEGSTHKALIVENLAAVNVDVVPAVGTFPVVPFNPAYILITLEGVIFRITFEVPQYTLESVGL